MFPKDELCSFIVAFRIGFIGVRFSIFPNTKYGFLTYNLVEENDQFLCGLKTINTITDNSV